MKSPCRSELPSALATARDGIDGVENPRRSGRVANGSQTAAAIAGWQRGAVRRSDEARRGPMTTPGNPTPPRRPPAAGGSALRPPPATPQRPHEPDDDADEKTAAFDLADLERALKSRQPAPAAPEPESEKTVALSLDGLPLEGPVPQRPVPRQVQRTLVGTPVAPRAVVPTVAPRPVRPAPQPRDAAPPSNEEAEDEKTQAVDMRAMIASIDAEHGAIAEHAEQAPPPRSTRAGAPAPAAAAPPPVTGAPPRAPAPAPRQPEPPARPVAPEVVRPASPVPAAQAPRVASPLSAEAPSTGEGLVGSIAFYIRHAAIEAAVARGEKPASALDRPKAATGLRNAWMLGGALLGLTLLAGFIA
jgi:hypothetical protein